MAAAPEVESGVSAAKGVIREAIKRQRAVLDAVWVAETSAAVETRVIAMDVFRAAETVLAYLALPHEVQTDGILAAAWRAGKRICVPAFRPGTGDYAAAWLEPADPIGPGHWKVPEPRAPRWVGDEARIDLAVVPGVAFDTNGRRLGHGRGYYDRLLGRMAGRIAYRVGVGFGFQIVERVPAGARDVPMNAVVTDETVHPGADRNGDEWNEHNGRDGAR